MYIYFFRCAAPTSHSLQIKILKRFGFEKVSQKGSHVKYRNSYTGKIFIIPMHSEIASGTLKSILEQANIELDQFLKSL